MCFSLFIKTNIFALVICLQKTSSRSINQHEYIHFSDLPSRRFQDVLQKHQHEYIILMICLFKKSSRRFAKTSRYLQDVLKTFLRDVFNTFLRSTAKMINQVTILRNLWLGYKISKSKVFGYSKTFQTAFFKNFLSSDCFYKQRYHC